jgi:hypothetical protein
MTNNLMSNIMVDATKSVIPTVGMGITICLYRDRHAGTITKVSPSGKTFWYKRDDVERIDNNGMSDSQTYKYTFNDKMPDEKVTLRKNGQWRETGTNYYIVLGTRDEYYDYSF